jgi:hypothetical protein
MKRFETLVLKFECCFVHHFSPNVAAIIISFSFPKFYLAADIMYWLCTHCVPNEVIFRMYISDKKLELFYAAV